VTGRVELRDLRALGVHGVLPHERERTQPFSCDVDAWFDAGPAAASDALGDTVDYGALAGLVASTVSDTSYSLLERLAAEVCARVLDAFPPIARVSVTVRKLRPPVPLDVASIGVTVLRERGR
jgi:dihydroneopterin aldolase